jgi:hypothetical protein
MEMFFMRKTRKAKTLVKPGRGESDFFNLETRAYLRACEGFDTPRSLTCYLLAKHGEWEQLISLPAPDSCSSTFIYDYGATNMFKKNPRIPLYTNESRAAAALRTWFESEALCKETNKRLRNEVLNRQDSLAPQTRLGKIFHAFGKELRRILGPVDYQFVSSNVGFGPGSTMSVKGRDVLPSRKLCVGNYTSTPGLIPLVTSLFPEGCTFCAVGYNEFTTVPKTAVTDRAIAIEPHVNVLVQKGIGALVRKRLRQAGLTPNDQSTNQKMALKAQRLDFATIDLSMASDTIARRLVEYSVSQEWFHLLNLARTPGTRIGDDVFVLEKFSSMGNGFTWELESAIFLAIARISCDGVGVSWSGVSVYGDDIVLPKKAFRVCCENLELLGFKVNSKKSFWQGDFYESCGVDVYKGQNIRPYFFKGDFDDFESNSIRMANGLRRYANRLGCGLYCDKRLYRAYRLVADNAGRGRQTGVPDGVGDDGLVRNLSEIVSLKRARSGLQGYRCLVLRRDPIPSRRSDANGLLWSYLFQYRDRSNYDALPEAAVSIKWRGLVSTRPGELISSIKITAPRMQVPIRDRHTRELKDVLCEPVRGQTKQPRFRVLHVFSWSDVGPWLGGS